MSLFYPEVDVLPAKKYSPHFAGYQICIILIFR